MSRNQCLSLSILHFIFSGFVFYTLVMSMGCGIDRGEPLGIYNMTYIGTDANREDLLVAVPMAMDAITEYGPWTEPQVKYAHGIAVVVMKTTHWVDEWDRDVCGLAHTDDHLIEVGIDLLALAHEIMEILYAEFEGTCITWHDCYWPGRILCEDANREYRDEWDTYRYANP